MASPETFESTLKEVVRAKRLSASKVKELTDIALKTIKDDTKLVSILYRTHKSLSPAHKINSLYAFDALSRAARSQVNKHNLSGDLNTEPGNCATFLLKVEGVLDGLFQDMIKTKHPDAKEKTKKILDIWVKGHTFPSDVLTRLEKLVKEALDKDKEPEKESSAASAPTADPRTQTTALAVSPPQAAAPAPSTTPPVSPPSTEAIQSTLLALLNKAANVVASSGNGQTVPNNAANVAIPPAAAPQLDPRQLALFQQLSQVAGAGNSAPPHPVPVPSLVPSAPPANAVLVAPPFGGPSQPLPYRDESNGFAAPRDTQYDSHNGPRPGREYYDHRRDPRGDFRGPPRNEHTRDPRGGEYRSEPFRGDFRGGPRGGFRGRGRGRWDDRDHHLNRSRENRWNPPQGRNPNSRSRSPTARNGRRPFSPPRDAPAPFHPSRSPTRSTTADHTTDSGKDEFGRDLRPSSPRSPDSAPAPTQVPEPSPLPSEPVPIASTADQAEGGEHEEPSASTHPVPMTIGVAAPMDDSDAPLEAPLGGLDVFDWSTFDYTSPVSWESLGKAWNVSHGYMPSQEELMQFFVMMSSGMGTGYPAPGPYDMQQSQQWSGPPPPQPPQQQQQNWGGGDSWRGRGGGRGRGRGYGDYGQGQAYGYGGRGGGGRGRGRGFDQDTDALTLAGGDDDGPSYGGPQDEQMWQGQGNYNAHQMPTGDANVGGGGSGGRMQKQGDRWVFVKADAS